MGHARPALTGVTGMLACALAVVALAGCGGDDDASQTTPAEGSSTSASESPASSSPSSSADASADAGSASASPAPEPGTELAVRVRGGSVEPRGKRVEVPAGEPLFLVVDSDTAGEVHVHATPETEFAFATGTTREKLVLEQPGIVEVELHEPTEVTVFQLEVR